MSDQEQQAPANANPEVPKHAGGRPTKYRKKYCKQLVAFMQKGGAIVHKPMTVSKGDRQGSDVVDHNLGQLPAFFEDFAVSIGISRSTFFNWVKDYKDFAEAHAIAKTIQRAQMIRGGLSGVYQGNAFIFAMKNMHDWRDKSELSGQDGAPISFKITVNLAE